MSLMEYLTDLSKVKFAHFAISVTDGKTKRSKG